MPGGFFYRESITQARTGLFTSLMRSVRKLVVSVREKHLIEHIRRYFQLGCEVKGLGRGHIQRIKDEIRKA